MMTWYNTVMPMHSVLWEILWMSLPLYDKYLLLAFSHTQYKPQTKTTVIYYTTVSFLQILFDKCFIVVHSWAISPQVTIPLFRSVTLSWVCRPNRKRWSVASSCKFYLTRLSTWREISKFYEISTILDICLYFILISTTCKRMLL